ncbi:hypothetical protein R1flu_014306 [Riccia fluitans]|uniref:Uncharacterized protein n=1 Tax=Riccia fluitans TaxID=41844 RepID=A0ABD1YGF5_9MARC
MVLLIEFAGDSDLPGDVKNFVTDEEFEGASEIHGVFVNANRNHELAVVEDLESTERTLMVKLTIELVLELVTSSKLKHRSWPNAKSFVSAGRQFK